MRRDDREIIDRSEIESILQNTMVCRIGLAIDDDPYVVPVSFGYENRTIYFHSARIGKKISMLKKNSRCCFEVDQCDNIIQCERPCDWGMRYRSVIGFGRAIFIKEREEKEKGLNCIMNHYGCRMHKFSDKDLRKICVIRIDIESMTGKKCD
jgi:uncharacterized protein